MGPSFALLALLASGDFAPAVRLELCPALTTTSAIAYGSGNLWVGAYNDLWRFGSKGSGERLTLPGDVRAIFPRGGSADVLLQNRLVRLTGSTVTDVTNFPFDVTNLAPVRDGYVALRDGRLWFHDGASEPVELAFVHVGATDSPQTPLVPFADSLADNTGTLIGLTPDSFAWVRDTPYELLVFRTDSTVRRLVVDESSVRDKLAADPVETMPGAPERVVRSRRGFLVESRILLLDRMQRRHVRWAELKPQFESRWRAMGEAGKAAIADQPADDETVVWPRAFVDAIDFETGKLVGRVELNNESGSAISGQFVGVRDDRLVLYDAANDGPTYLAFIPWTQLIGTFHAPSEASDAARPSVGP